MRQVKSAFALCLLALSGFGDATLDVWGTKRQAVAESVLAKERWREMVFGTFTIAGESPHGGESKDEAGELGYFLVEVKLV